MLNSVVYAQDGGRINVLTSDFYKPIVTLEARLRTSNDIRGVKAVSRPLIQGCKTDLNIHAAWIYHALQF